MRSAPLEELRERAGELQIEGRSTMSKDELIAAPTPALQGTAARPPPAVARLCVSHAGRAASMSGDDQALSRRENHRWRNQLIVASRR